MQDNEDRQWDLYCAVTANPFADDVGSFENFKRTFMKSAPNNREPEETTKDVMNNKQIELQVEQADRILQGFVPPAKGGD